MRASLLPVLVPCLVLLAPLQAEARLVDTGTEKPHDEFMASQGKLKMPRVLSEFSRLAHDLRSGNVTVMDERTFYIPRLYYDGTGPDAYFLVGTGRKVTRRGTKVPDETGSLEPLKQYHGESIKIELRGNRKIGEFDWLAMYCIQHRHLFGKVKIPKDLDVPASYSRP